MMTFAPLSRETASNRGGFIGRVWTNAQQQDFTVGVPCHKPRSVAVSALELPVERTLQFWLESGVQIEAQLYRRKTVLERHLHQAVNRCFVQREGEKFHHSPRGLNQTKRSSPTSNCIGRS